jgi:competence protein ComEA
MVDSPVVPPRPAPPRRFGDLAAAWLAWFGIGRLIATAACTVIVGVGAFWLLRAPAPSPEAGLAFASPSTGVPVTLPEPTGTASTDAAEQIVVHVAGAVAAPGVHQLDSGDRVHDAVSAAGGATPEADLEGLNLAALLVDGTRIYVPSAGEVDPATVPSGLGSDVAGSSPGPIDLNRASADQLEGLPGVGPATAAEIVGDRQRNGPFASVDDLDRVPGIGPAKLATLRDLVTV